jgi:hypothetical protein
VPGQRCRAQGLALEASPFYRLLVELAGKSFTGTVAELHGLRRRNVRSDRPRLRG